MEIMIECGECSGTGLIFSNASEDKPSSWVECNICKGRGKIDPYAGQLKPINESGPKE
jgi:ribosomal protein S27E